MTFLVTSLFDGHATTDGDYDPRVTMKEVTQWQDYTDKEVTPDGDGDKLKLKLVSDKSITIINTFLNYCTVLGHYHHV